MSKINTLPTFGQAVQGQGGLLGGIMRGSVVNGKRQPDYALIVADAAAGGDLGKLTWGKRDQDVAGASSLTDGQTNTAAMAKAKSPAALAVRALKIDDLADWYIPSRAEMWALRANVPELFANEIHWTSTQTAPTRSPRTSPAASATGTARTSSFAFVPSAGFTFTTPSLNHFPHPPAQPVREFF